MFTNPANCGAPVSYGVDDRRQLGCEGGAKVSYSRDYLSLRPYAEGRARSLSHGFQIPRGWRFRGAGDERERYTVLLLHEGNQLCRLFAFSSFFFFADKYPSVMNAPPKAYMEKIKEKLRSLSA